MQYTLAALGLAALAQALPQSSSGVPSGCSTSYSGSFKFDVVNVTAVSSKAKRQSQSDAALIVTLNNGVLTDDQGRQGYVASNDQLQFNSPVQTNAIATSGFSVCANNSLALSGSAIWYQCLSGDFYNLYDKSIGAQCGPVYIYALAASGSSSASATGAVTQSSDGQPEATSAATAVPTSSAKVVTQISDGQLQAPTSTGNVVSQISDGQIQAPTSTGKVVSQISDGQIQAPTTTGKVVSQISDGQIQAPTTTGKVVSQISDGQIQAPTSTMNGTMASPTASAIAYTGAAALPTAISGAFGVAAGLLAVAML